MPVIGHHRVGKDRQRLSLDGFRQHALEGLVIVLLLEQRQPRDGPIEHVKTHSGWTDSRTTWHARTCLASCGLILQVGVGLRSCGRRIAMSEGKPTYDQLVALVQQQATEIARLKRRVIELEELLQAAHRQAAPFRRDERRKKPAAQKKRPGRPEGHEGTYRQRPEVIDEHIEVPLPCCPHCEGKLSDVQQRNQYIEELPPVRPLCFHVTTWTGVCPQCGEVQSTHPLQTSTASGAAGNHLGPRAQGLALLLAHRSGLTMRRTCQVLQDLCGLRLSPGGLAQLLQRAVDRLEPLRAKIEQQIRHSAAVHADETSWYVGEPLCCVKKGGWLWVFTTPQATLYRVEPGRGSDVVIDTLGNDFAGMLVSDCLASYNAIDCRKHKCIAHHLKVLKEHEESLAKQGIVSEDLRLWKILLKNVIATWKKREQVKPSTYARKVRQLQRGVQNLLGRSPPEAEAVAFRNRLARQRDHLLGCLSEPAAEPTNNRAERDLRPAVISRKLSCGNKTIAGKQAWETLRSVITTLPKQGTDLLETLTPHLRLATQ